MLRSVKVLSAACPFTKTTVETGKIRDFSEIPGPKEVPFIGSFENLKFAFGGDRKTVGNYTKHLVELYEKYGPVVRESQGFGRKHLVHVFDPVDAQTVFSADGKTPFIQPLQETTQKYRKMKGLNPGLGNLNGAEWYRLRSSINQAVMRPQAVQTYQPFSEKCGEELVKHIEREQNTVGHVDMRKVAGRWSVESAGQILFERSLGALKESGQQKWADDFVNLNREIFQLSAKMRLGLPLFRLFPTPSWNKMIELEDRFYGEVDQLMDETLDNLTSSSGENSEEMRFASYLINREELNRNDIKAIMFSMFTDGLSTTAPMLVYNLFNIAKHPEAQNEIRKEIQEGNTKLPYLRACIKENFRLFPIGTEFSRITQKDLVLGGFHVPAGTPVDINTNVLSRTQKMFIDSPEEYKPSRWLEKSDNPSVHPFAFLPFGFGPRMCVGRRFAEQDLITVLPKLVANFEISHIGEDMTQTYETLLAPDGSCDFVFKKL